MRCYIDIVKEQSDMNDMPHLEIIFIYRALSEIKEKVEWDTEYLAKNACRTMQRKQPRPVIAAIFRADLGHLLPAIEQMNMGRTVTMALGGQLVTSALAAHLGYPWRHLYLLKTFNVLTLALQLTIM